MENCCTWLVICLNCTIMNGLTNLKSIFVYLENRRKSIKLSVGKKKYSFGTVKAGNDCGLSDKMCAPMYAF